MEPSLPAVADEEEAQEEVAEEEVGKFRPQANEWGLTMVAAPPEPKGEEGEREVGAATGASCSLSLIHI